MCPATHLGLGDGRRGAEPGDVAAFGRLHDAVRALAPNQPLGRRLAWEAFDSSDTTVMQE